MGRNSRKAHLIGGLAMGGKTSSTLVEHIQAAVLLIHGKRTAPRPWSKGSVFAQSCDPPERTVSS
jgi:hypothetical protein